jgi:large subunit ribosomal protein L22
MTSKEHIASVNGQNLSISTKHTIAISDFIRGKSVQKSKRILESVLEMKTPVPFKKHKRKIAHKRGKIAAGRYPINATKEVLILLKSLEANAQNKGLNVESLYITSIIPNQASRPWHYGRHRRIKMKRTHLRITAEEKQQKTKPKQVKKETKEKDKK